MTPFKIEENLDPLILTYRIFGYINEHAQFPERKSFPVAVSISLKEVTGLNSVGTRIWCQWVKTMATVKLIEIDDSPAIFVKAFNTVAGALSSNMTVGSFFVPYISQTGVRKDVLITNSPGFDPRSLETKTVLDANGFPMELDVLPDYFRFLKK